MNYVLDASAILRYLEDQAGAARVEELINQARSARCELSISAANWGEILYVLRRKFSPDDVMLIAAKLRALPIAISPVTQLDAENAAEFKSQYALPYADSFAAALASSLKGTLVTADFDLKACGRAITIEFL